MKEPETIIHIYQTIISESKEKLNKVQKRIYHIGSIRLLLFVAGIAGIIYFWPADWPVIGGVIAFTFIPFLVLVKHHNKLFYKKEYLEKKIEINEQEIGAINYNISSFDNGNEFTDDTHLYSFDLDVFGDRSLYQYINRTSTDLGRKQLAEWLSNHLTDKKEIERRQDAIKEIACELRFRQRLRILGLLYKGERAHEEEIREWAKSPSYYRSKAFVRALPVIVPSINTVAIILAMSHIIPFSMVGVLIVCFIVCSMTFSRKITKIQELYGKKLQILGTYAHLIELIEEKEMSAEFLQNIKSLVDNNKKTASQSVKKLSSLMHALDQRNNMLMAAILNGFMFWELKQMMKIEAWKEECANDLPQWLEAIAQMDAICSLGTFAYNHPAYIYPQIESHPFLLHARELGHPLMNRDKCVRNDVDMVKRPFFTIITGANMAGKSTYLRTIGVNHLLACIGAPVCAVEMKIYPTKLITSLRTSDSLNDNESYFFAELKRLKLIIDKLTAKEELFIILDEILKGTNSKDKQKGSIALIEQFMGLNTNGIIATHDLLLGSLAEVYPDNINNFCFEAEIKDNELTFSYQLKKGIAQNMNACFLMKKMGIAVITDA